MTDNCFAHWTAEDWKRLNEQRRRDRERLRRQLAEDVERLRRRALKLLK